MDPISQPDNTPGWMIPQPIGNNYEASFKAAEQALLDWGVVPEEIISTLNECCDVRPRQWGTHFNALWDNYLHWRFMTGRDPEPRHTGEEHQ